MWLMVAKTLGFMLSIAVPSLIARRLDRIEMGHYKQIFQLMATAGALLSLGFGATAFYFFPREPAKHRSICLNILLVCGGVSGTAGAILAFFPGLLVWLFDEKALAAYAPAVGLLIPFWVIALQLETFPVVMQEFRFAGGLIVGSNLSRAMMLFAAAAIFGTVKAIVFATIVHTAIQTAVVFWYLESRLPGFGTAFDWKLLRAQIAYQAPFTIGGILYVVQSDWHDYFVSRTFGAAIFAAYSIGCADLPLIGILIDSATSVMIGRVSELRAVDHIHEIVALTARVARKLALVFFAFFALLMIVGRDLIRFIYTDKFIDAWPIFRVNCLILMMFPILFDPIARAFPEKMAFFVRVRFVLFLGMIAALWFFTARYGPVAAISVVVGRLAVENIFSGFYYGRILRFRKSDLRAFSPLIPIAVSAAGAGAAIFLLHPIVGTFTSGHGLAGWRQPLTILVVCSAAFFAVYLLILMLLRVPTPEERGKILRILGGRFGLFASDSL